MRNITEIARQAYLWGYPIVDNYSVLYSFSLDPNSPEYKAPLNHISHARTIAGPDNRAIVSPNVDTPYSYAWLDLRTEPIVLSLPAFEETRYVSLQLIDSYTYIIDYVTPRTNGNRGGHFLVTSPQWQGETPPGIKQIFRSPTELVLAFYRTQILGSGDLENVHKLQDQYLVRPLSAFLNVPAPPPAPPLHPIEPVDIRKHPTSLQFFNVLNWMLATMPTFPEEAEMRNRFAEIGICPGEPFPTPVPELQAAIVEGMKLALHELQAGVGRVKSSAELFGSRKFLGRNYLTRAIAAMIGIYGNAAEEFLGVGYQTDSEGRPFDGKHSYQIRFTANGLPPVAAFWSITVYTQERFVYANPLNRYSISSLMLPIMSKDIDGGFTLYLQHLSPGADKENNWLPIPDEPFFLTFRTYLPGEAIRQGKWVAPPVICIS
ncbi:DUF1254 domain-containing protein [Leptolyngbya ohadii]|uniref:DUF1254 domain-containing protein n=1 Tax=Leptolyngbya ohadii TaxID=1962290 RepID=UPI000B599A81|nr:DUF1254 domain-containing protein [Leptolyngbya ohadii]